MTQSETHNKRSDV